MLPVNSRSSSRHSAWVKDILLLCILFLFCSTHAWGKTRQGEPAPVPENSVQKTTQTQIQDKDLADLQPKVTEIAVKKLDMLAELSGLDDTSKIIEQLLKVSEAKNNIEERFHVLKTDPDENSRHLSQLQNELLVVERNSRYTTASLDSSLAVLDQWLDFWADEEEELGQWQQGLGASSTLPIVQKKLAKLHSMVDDARQTIDGHLLPLLKLQERSGSLQIAAHELHLRVDTLFKGRYQQGVYRHAVPLFSREFINQFNSKLLLNAQEGMKDMLPDLQFGFKQKNIFLITLLLFFLFWGTLFSIRKYVSSSAQWDFVTRRPISVALFLSLLVFIALTDNLPPFWLALLRGLTLISVIRISRIIMTDRLEKNGITRLALLLLATDMLVMANMPIPLMRLYILLTAIVYILVFWVEKYKGYRLVPWLLWARRLALAFLIVVLVSEVSGKADLAFLIYFASLKTFYYALFFWVYYLILMALLALGLHFIPLKSISDNTHHIAAMIRPFVLIGCLLSFFSDSLVAWRVFTTGREGMDFLGGLGFSYGENHITLGLILVSVCILYLAYCLSRSIQAILLNSVLPRHNIDKGVQLSITRLLHYSIMLIGFLMAMGAMGFSLTNLTILGGALGVGIGFGLQEIIKNFACGLILLFERPIKLGDTIEVGGELAEVKELGLRATVVETFDKAEIVLPNADLITGQVINWTLQERRVRVKVPVGVAYGSDVEQVLRILITCAEEHPLVLSTPPPRALFRSFGDSSLDFELRVFIPELNERIQVQSDLNQTIESEFSDAGIEIPFPQSDLHLRSVDEDVAALLAARA